MKYRIRPFIPEPGFLTVTLIFLQFCYYAIFLFNGVDGFSLSAADIFFMAFSFLSLYLISSVIETMMPVRIIARMTSPLIIFSAWILYAYRLSTDSSLDFSLVKDNIGISFSAEALQMMSSPFSNTDFLFISALMCAVIYLDYRYSLFPRKKSIEWRSGGAAFIITVFIIILPVHRGDEFTLFIKSIFTGDTVSASVTDAGGYPYHRDSFKSTYGGMKLSSASAGKPNVILIMIESFNANFVEAKASDGADYTPNFNSMIGRGLYIDRFYGNSIQTCKGQAAIFYSVLPSTGGKIFVDYPELNITGFPALLEESGYHTVYFQAFHNLEFDNTTHNMQKAGFSVIKSYAEFRKKEDRPFIWGWGVEDKIFYERAFELLDAEHEKNPGKPLFAALMTVGTHIPCDGMPVESRTIYKDPENIKEKYSNALRLSDSHLPRFFELMKQREYLKNTVVIITSDHSFPMKEHGVYNNEICFYDEAFRIPFLVLWEGIVKPERIKDRAYSQIDIGPTIADITGIKSGRHNMAGLSVFDRRSPNKVYLIQPYNGKFLQVVDYPLKYITHLKTGKEYLFNLAEDPEEQVNLMDKEYNSEEISELRESINAIYLNQKLIEENRILRP